MKFSQFLQFHPKTVQNVFVFVCEDDFLVEESRPVWQRIFGGGWVFEKYTAKEFEEILEGRLLDDARTPSLFAQNRVLIVTGAEKLTKGRIEVLTALQDISVSCLKVVLVTVKSKSLDSWRKVFPVVEIDSLKPADVVRWLVDRYKFAPQTARYLMENVGTDLYQLHTEVEKLRTYTGNARPIEPRDIDILILRSEQFGPFELDDAILDQDYKKAMTLVGAMLADGLDPLVILARIVRVWRQLFIGKALVGKRSAREIAAAAAAPVWKAAEFVASCRKLEWRQLIRGFRLLLSADRAFKSSTPNPEGYLDVMLLKLIGPFTRPNY